jgi:hypothetical protein
MGEQFYQYVDCLLLKKLNLIELIVDKITRPLLLQMSGDFDFYQFGICICWSISMRFTPGRAASTRSSYSM